MRKILLFLLVTAFAAGSAFAHGGKSHRLLGTVKAVEESRLTLTTRDGEEREVRLTADTRYERGGKAGSRSDLAAGVRVVVTLDEADTTAVEVKIGASAGG